MFERNSRASRNLVGPGVTGQSMPPAGLYPGLKRTRLDYTQVYYGLGQFIPSQAKLYTHDINHDTIVLSDILNNYLIFQQVTEDSVLSDKLSEKVKLTELNLKTLKLTVKFVFHG